MIIENNLKFNLVWLCLLFLFSCSENKNYTTIYSLELSLPLDYVLCGEYNKGNFSPPEEYLRINTKVFKNNNYEKVFFNISETANVVPPKEDVYTYVKELNDGYNYSYKGKFKIEAISNTIYSYYILTEDSDYDVKCIEAFFYTENVLVKINFYERGDVKAAEEIIEMIKNVNVKKTEKIKIEKLNTLENCGIYISNHSGIATFSESF